MLRDSDRSYFPTLNAVLPQVIEADAGSHTDMRQVSWAIRQVHSEGVPIGVTRRTLLAMGVPMRAAGDDWELIGYRLRVDASLNDKLRALRRGDE